MIFDIDGILLLDSSMPQCKGFTGMALFVFVTLGFDSQAILSNPDCLESFSGQVISSALVTVGLGIMIHLLMKRKMNRIQKEQKLIFD